MIGCGEDASSSTTLAPDWLLVLGTFANVAEKIGKILQASLKLLALFECCLSMGVFFIVAKRHQFTENNSYSLTKQVALIYFYHKREIWKHEHATIINKTYPCSSQNNYLPIENLKTIAKYWRVLSAAIENEVNREQ